MCAGGPSGRAQSLGAKYRRWTSPRRRHRLVLRRIRHGDGDDPARRHLPLRRRGRPVTDWLDYDTHYTERYMDLPSANPEGTGNPRPHLRLQLSRPLLLIHGLTDDNVYVMHTSSWPTPHQGGKPFDLLPLTGTHLMSDPS